MGRRKTTQSDESTIEIGGLPPIPGETVVQMTTEEPSAQSQLADKEIEQILGEVGSGARVRIQRVNPDTGIPAHVGEIPADGFSLETLADTYGGGRYHLRVFVGKEQKGARTIVEIDPAIPPRNPRAPKGTAAAAAPGGNLAADALLAIVSGSAATNNQMMQTMMAMMGAFTTAITSMMQMKGSDKDPMDYALRMTELINAGRVNKSTSIEELKSLLEISDMIGGRGNGDGDSELGLVKEGIKVVGQIVEKAQTAPPAAVALPARTPVQTPVTPSHIPPATSPVRPWLAAVAPSLPQIRGAVGTFSPELVAGMVEERLDDIAWHDLIADITTDMNAGDPITPEKCTSFAQRVATQLQIPPQHIPWLAKLAAEILTIHNEGFEDGGEENSGEAQTKTT